MTKRDPGLLTITEVAEIFRCRPKAVWNYLRSGRIAGVFFGGKWLISRKLVESKLADAGALIDDEAPEATN